MKPILTKSLITSIATLGVIGMSSSPIYAVTPSPTPNAAKLAAVQAKGDTDISVRLTSLGSLISSVSASTKLSSAQKSSLSAEMQGEVTALTALKSKIETDTDIPTTRADYAMIFSAHYIYAFYIPRVNRILAADAQSDAAATLTTLATTLQGYVTQAKTAGNDVTALQTALTDMQAKATDATTQSQNALSTLLPLTSAGYPNNKTTVQGTSTSITTARTDLKTARADAGTIVAALKKMLGLK